MSRQDIDESSKIHILSAGDICFLSTGLKTEMLSIVSCALLALYLGNLKVHPVKTSNLSKYDYHAKNNDDVLAKRVARSVLSKGQLYYIL